MHPIALLLGGRGTRDHVLLLMRDYFTFYVVAKDEVGDCGGDNEDGDISGREDNLKPWCEEVLGETWENRSRKGNLVSLNKRYLEMYIRPLEEIHL